MGTGQRLGTGRFGGYGGLGEDGKDWDGGSSC